MIGTVWPKVGDRQVNEQDGDGTAYCTTDARRASHRQAILDGAKPEYLTVSGASVNHVQDAVAELHASGGWSISDEDGLTVRRHRDQDGFHATLWRPARE